MLKFFDIDEHVVLLSMDIIFKLPTYTFMNWRLSILIKALVCHNKLHRIYSIAQISSKIDRNR